MARKLLRSCANWQATWTLPSPMKEDVQKSLEITVDIDVESGSLDRSKYKALGDKGACFLSQYEAYCYYITGIKSADHNDWAACINNRAHFYESKNITLPIS